MANDTRIDTFGPFDLIHATKVLVDINVMRYTHLSIYAADGGGSTYWGAGTNAIVNVMWRNSAQHAPIDFTTPVTISDPESGVGMDQASEIDVSRVAIVSLVVATAEANTKGTFYVCLRDNRGA